MIEYPKEVLLAADGAEDSARAARVAVALAEIRAEGGDVAEAHLRMGRPAPEAVALATDLEVDLVVVGSGDPHAMRRAVATTTRRATLGKVAIVRAAPCPVDTKEGDG